MPPGQDAAGSRPDPPSSRRLRDHRRRSGRKTLVQLAQSGDLAAKRQATWGMSVHRPPASRQHPEQSTSGQIATRATPPVHRRGPQRPQDNHPPTTIFAHIRLRTIQHALAPDLGGKSVSTADVRQNAHPCPAPPAAALRRLRRSALLIGTPPGCPKNPLLSAKPCRARSMPHDRTNDTI